MSQGLRKGSDFGCRHGVSFHVPSTRTSIVIDGSDGEILGADGDVRYALRRGPGEVRYFGPGEVPLTHALRNTGERDIRIVVVELLT